MEDSKSLYYGRAYDIVHRQVIVALVVSHSVLYKITPNNYNISSASIKA